MCKSKDQGNEIMFSALLISCGKFIRMAEATFGEVKITLAPSKDIFLIITLWYHYNTVYYKHINTLCYKKEVNLACRKLLIMRKSES